ncbi:MAG: hypothetical protein Q9191_006749 [Dirinaria sp. TL-2023a]
MAAAQHMQRPYPAVYHTPQSNSPASVTSSQGHDQHGRLYGQPPPQIPQGMYSYSGYPSMNQVHPSAYAQHQPPPPPPQQQQQQQQPQPQPQQQQQHPNITSQHLLMSHPGQPPIQHQPPTPTSAMTNSPRPKVERPSDIATMQRPPSVPMNSTHNTPTGPPTNGNTPHSAGPNAAPGPIPATTPLVVRQDNNGVQWIAFEYSRDRVKMEYTIRCDVENVDHNQLSSEFKTDNCVYPRACCNKENYRGNRLQYETECNTVGWALAELNPCLRGKRGLIQRAVDSWRNSNQDPRLRSRRVRRMAKMTNRKQAPVPAPNHMAGPGGSGAPQVGPQSGKPIAAPAQRPSQNSNGIIPHHHPGAEEGAPGSSEEVSANGDYENQRQSVSRSHPANATGDVRPSHVFHGFPNYPSNHAVGTAIAPPLHDGMGTLGGHPVSNHTAVASSVPKAEAAERSPAPFCDVNEAKRRKFILVEDPEGGKRVRVRVTLENSNIIEAPDDFRRRNCVYPRSFAPVGMPMEPRSARGNRFCADDDSEDEKDEDGHVTKGRTFVPMPTLDNAEGEIPVPRIVRSRKRKEKLLNDLGYRMAWGQTKTFDRRTIFLQRARMYYWLGIQARLLTADPVDAYRNNMASRIKEGGTEVSVIAPHFETRVGKRRWMTRKGGPKKEPTG